MNNLQTRSKRLVRNNGQTETEHAEAPNWGVQTQDIESKNHPSKMVIFGLSPGGASREPGSKRHIRNFREIGRFVSSGGGAGHA